MISMSLYDIIQNILDVSKNHNLVREVGEGDIYNYLNSSEHQYPCVFLTVSSINDDLNLRNVNCTLFYVDRLTSDESNKILVQSLGLSVLSDIVERIAGDIDTVEYTTFTEKFTDLCGGVYASLSIGYPLDGACSNDFEVRELEVTENGVYDVLGYDRIVVTTSPKFVVLDGMKFANSTLTEFPEGFDFSNVADFGSMFEDCNKLTSIPLIDTSKGTEFYNIFCKCSSLTHIPHLITSNGTRFSYMFSYCSSLTSVPPIDTSNGTEFEFMFHNCSKLTDIPLIDTSKGVEFGSMFQGCSNLTSIPQLDVSKGKTFGSMFGGCSKLTNIPYLDTSNGTEFEAMFSGCSNLTSVPPIDTSKSRYFSFMFYDCSNLTSIPRLDISSGTILGYMFNGCNKLTTITFTGCINADIDFSPCRSLTYESVKSILTACSNTNNTKSKTLKFRRTLTDQNSELANLITTCNTKGWTVSGLTLQ